METKILERLGLTPGEIKAYLALLKLGPSSTGAIAKKSNVSRSKLYSILDKLEKKGMASHVEKRGVIYFQAVEPSKIKDYITEKEKELKTLREEFDRFLPQLQAFHEEKAKIQNVTVYQGFKGLVVANEHIYLKLKKGDDYQVLGVPVYPKWERKGYWQRDHERRDKEGIRCRMLFNPGVPKDVLRNRNSYKLCEARYMPIKIDAPAYFMIYADTSVIVIASEEPLAIEIVSKEIADSFRRYFEEFWRMSKPSR
jgi:sugar-specific transcriptional regulator TrmB